MISEPVASRAKLAESPTGACASTATRVGSSNERTQSDRRSYTPRFSRLSLGPTLFRTNARPSVTGAVAQANAPAPACTMPASVSRAPPCAVHLTTCVTASPVVSTSMRGSGTAPVLVRVADRITRPP